MTMPSPTTLDRRGFLGGAAALLALPAEARGAALAGLPSAADYRIRPGEADQSGALQRALDANGGRPLFLPPGRYRAGGLRLPPGGGLVGVEGRSVLQATGPGTMLSARDGGDILVEGMVLDGAGRVARDNALLTVQSTARLVVERCGFRSGLGKGVSLEQTGGRVARSGFAAFGDAALFALDSTGLLVVENDIREIGDNGVQIWTSAKRSDGSIVKDNRIARIGAVSGGSGQYGNGVNVFRAGGVTVAGNRIEDCAFSAVRNNAGDNGQILGNVCSGLGETAIFVEFGFEGAVVSSNTVDGAATGISITNFNEGGRLAVCSGNLVRNLTPQGGPDQLGIGIAVEADTAVTGNVVDNAAYAGLTLGWGPHLRNVGATGNLVRASPIGIAVSVAPGARDALIAQNLIAGASGGAIVAREWDRVVARDLAEGGAARYAQLTIGGNRVS